MSEAQASSPPVVSLSEFRLALSGDGPRALFDHWHAKRGDRALPEPREIDPIEIGAAPLPHLFTLDVEEDERYRFRLTGTLLPRIFGKEVAGKFLEEVLPERDMDNARRSYGLITQGFHAWHSIVVYLRDGEGAVNWERIALPLGRDGRVTRILGGIFIDSPFGEIENYDEMYSRGGLELQSRDERLMAATAPG